MRGRLGSLKRVTALRRSLEAARLADLQRSTAQLNDAQRTVEAQRVVGFDAKIAARAALAEGDLMGWRVSENEAQMAARKGERLRQVEIECEASHASARNEYLTSRLQSRQMQHVLDNAKEELEAVESRVMQATTDDRYLARLRWLELRDQPRPNMKIS